MRVRSYVLARTLWALIWTKAGAIGAQVCEEAAAGASPLFGAGGGNFRPSPCPKCPLRRRPWLRTPGRHRPRADACRKCPPPPPTSSQHMAHLQLTGVPGRISQLSFPIAEEPRSRACDAPPLRRCAADLWRNRRLALGIFSGQFCGAPTTMEEVANTMGQLGPQLGTAAPQSFVWYHAEPKVAAWSAQSPKSAHQRHS